jgi:peroxiredoxin
MTSPGPDLPVVQEDALWITPPFQPVRALASLAFTALGFGLYEYVLVSFWSVRWMGIHERTPWPAFAILAAAMFCTLAAVRLALGIWSPHAKLGFGMLAFLASVAIGIGGGRFVSYAMRGTLNPPFDLKLAVGQPFPDFALPDQSGAIVRGPKRSGVRATLIVIYRGDFDPFARFGLAELTSRADEFRSAGVDVVAISADGVDRSRMLAGYLHTPIPLLSDATEIVVAPLGLVQHHRNGEPDNSIPAYFVVDDAGVVRWTCTSPYYRELPAPEKLLDAAKSVTH